MTSAERVPLSRMRRRIGRRMIESLATSPHVTMSVDVDYAAIAEARRTDPSAGYLPFVASSVCRALADFPDLNATIDGTDLLRFSTVHLGIAVDLDGTGLVVPVVRDAGAMSVAELARAIATLGAAAREGGLTPDDVGGATFTISSPGRLGADRSTPIIDQPQVAILAVDAIRDRPVARHQAVEVHPVGALSLSFDHRVADGVYASRFLQLVRSTLEDHLISNHQS